MSSHLEGMRIQPEFSADQRRAKIRAQVKQMLQKLAARYAENQLDERSRTEKSTEAHRA